MTGEEEERRWEEARRWEGDEEVGTRQEEQVVSEVEEVRKGEAERNERRSGGHEEK